MSTPTIKLNSGYEMPIFGLGTWQAERQVLIDSIKEAVKSGYRLVDTAPVYENEDVVGEAIHQCIEEGLVKREEIFITTKLWLIYFDPEDVEKACRQSLKHLQTDYIDLLLVHWPFELRLGEDELAKRDPNDFYKVKMFPSLDSEKIGYNAERMAKTWAAMENLVAKGLVRSIGVSNFTNKKITELLKTAKIVPAMSQVEMNPAIQQEKHIEFCHAHGIQVTSYTPFGRPINDQSGHMIPLKNEKLQAIAKKHNKSVAQIIIRWIVQQNVVAIPKSSTPKRILENFDVFNFNLDKEDFETIKTLNTNDRVWNGDFLYPEGQDWRPLWDGEYPESF